MDNPHYSVEELIDRPDFREWTLDPQRGNQYWTKLQREQEPMRPIIHEASRIVKLLSWEEPKLPKNEYSNSLSRLQKEITQIKVRSKKATFDFSWLKVAAVLLPIFVAATTYYFFAPRQQSEFKNIVFTTPAGQNSSITLPDGSEVMLKGSTRIEVSEGYGKHNRNIEIDGEAFFSVQRNEELPFQVKAASFLVRVLGTRFNMKAYSEDPSIYTTLVHGKIEVTEAISHHHSILTPGDQLVFMKDSLIARKQKVNTQFFDRWHGQGMIYEKVPVVQIIKDIERIYDVHVQYNGDFLSKKVLTCVFEPGEPLEKVLQVIARTASFKYEIDNRNIIIK